MIILRAVLWRRAVSPGARRRSNRGGSFAASLLSAARWILLVAMLVLSIAPIFWMAVAALEAGGTPLAAGNPWWPERPALDNFAQLFQDPQFGHWALNTVQVIAGALLIGVVASLLAGYALAYLDVPYSRSIVLVFFATYLLPQAVLFIPLLRVLNRLHLLNSPAALIVTYPSMVIPFGTWVVWSFLRRLPRDLIDSARSDGAGVYATIVHIMLPVLWPALATTALFAVAVVFNDYLYASTFIQESSSQTIMGALGALITADIDNPGKSFAAAMLSTVPLALICAFFADAFARGLSSGIIEQ
jgi:multiple sugar transport system permease protein